MKKFLTASFLTLGIILISGCSLTEQKPVDNSAITEQITALQQQMSDCSSQMETLKNENEQLKKESEELKKENNTLKINNNSESETSVVDLQNEKLKKEVENYKQALLQGKLKNKEQSNELGETEKNSKTQNEQNLNTSTNIENWENTPADIKSINQNMNNSIEERYEIEIDILSPNPDFMPGITDFFINQSTKLRKVKISYAANVYKCKDTLAQVVYPLGSFISDIESAIKNNGYTTWYMDIENGIITNFYEQCLP